MLPRKLLLVPVILLALASCRKEKSEATIKEKVFDFTGFTQVYTSENIKLTIEQGAAFSVKAKGVASNVDRLDIKLTDDDQTLDIAYHNGATNDLVNVTVIMPDLETAYLAGHVQAEIKKFHNQAGTLGLVLSGAAKATAWDGASIFGVEVGGNAELTLKGLTASLAGEISGNGVVKAYDLTATRVYISTSQNAKAYVRPSQIFFGSADDDSRIFYKGDPQDIELITSGNGEIIKE